ncbi:MAG: hypothetical protein HDR14_08650 [Lachnospiraceae bacterium]|nr:hypothetical protein [Lachnospiraceae bacterium]
MDDNNLQQEQQNQQVNGQQPAAEQASQTQPAAVDGQQPVAGQMPQTMQTAAYEQQPVQAQPAAEQMQQNPQAYAYNQQPVQNQQAYTYGQQPMQDPQSYTYGQQPMQNQQVYTYGQQPMQNQQAYTYGQQPMQNQQAYTYAQQPVQNQSPYMYGAPMQPVPAPAEGGKKKKKTGLVIAGVLVAVIAIAVGIGIFVHASMSNSPQARLAKGFENLAEEMAAGETAILEDIDYPTILKMLETDGGNVDLSLNFTIPGEDTIGFDYTQNYDRVNKLMNADLTVSAYNISLVQMKLAANDERLYFSMPGMLSNTYYVNTATFGEEFNDSVWREMWGRYGVDRDYALDLFPEPTEDEEESDDGIFEEILKEFAEGITIENGESKEFQIDGKTVRCSGINVTIEREAINDLFDEIEKELAGTGRDIDISFRLEADVKLTVYLDKKDRIVCIETFEEIKIEDSEVEGIEFTFVFSGKERTVDEIFGTITLTTPDDAPYIELGGKSALTAAEYSSEFVITFGDNTGMAEMAWEVTWDLKNREFEAVYKVYDEIEEFAFEIKGGFEDVEKGKHATFRLGQLKVLEDGEELCRLSGALTLGPITDTIEMPSEGVNFLKMSQSDILELIEEIRDSINTPDNPWGVSLL